MEIRGAHAIPEDVQAGYVAAGLWNDAGLRDGLEAHARRTPTRTAVVDATGEWSYARLEESVARALGCLRNQGVGAGSSVLVIAPLSAPAVIAYHAIIRAGAVAVMLDRRCGRTDVHHAVGAAGVGLVVTTPELFEQLGLAGTGLPFVPFDDLLAWPSAVRDWTEPDPSRPLTVVFTSGTTDRPKSAVHSLNTLRSGARNMADALEMTDRDVAFLSTPVASITGLVQVHLTLDNGGGLVLEDRFHPSASLDRLCAHGATVFGGAPVIMEELFKDALARDLPSLPLRAVSVGGAMIPRSMLELGVERYGITPVRVYGSSEVPCATITLPADQGEDRLGNDGACARGTEVRTDGDLPGEILVRGPMRFLGYLDEEHNREAFAGDGWYRTGDLGRFEGGRLTVTGRLKETVARKGMKISLNEIDEVSRRLPHAEEVSAYGVPDPDTGERLVLALYTERPDAVDFDSVIGWLLDAGLAKWKLPEQIVLWDEPLPRTTSGKLQRRMIAVGAEDRPTLLAPRLRPSS
jgi:acyl-CoA synthetase (AMP-forming)/AMP-acid ligase II